MKQKLFPRILGSILLLTIASCIYAQQVTELQPVTVTSTSKVTKKVAKSFEGSFKDAVSPSWYKLNKDYFVHFIMDDQKNSALFAKSGMLIYHISYGHENNLPADIKSMVQSSYGGYNITMAIKVEEQQRKIWVINLENDQKFIIARVEDDILEEVGNYNKS